MLTMLARHRNKLWECLAHTLFLSHACHVPTLPPSRVALQVAFALAFYALLRGSTGFTTVWESMVTMFSMSMGEATVQFSEER